VARPMPVSHVDQMATSVVEYRKSGISLRPLMNGIRTMVAVEPLLGCQSVRKRSTHVER
jgi:hypothetical protein